ncbi:MAG: phage tail tape measure protein [Bacteroidota bacterium]
MPATVKIPTEFIGRDRGMGSTIKRIVKDLKRFSNKGVHHVSRLNQKFNHLFKNMSQFSQMALGFGMATLFAAGIQNNIDYNDSLISMSSITGAVGKDLAILESQAMSVAKATNTMGKDVLFGMEEIASAKPELLKTPKALADITENAIILSKAAKMDLATAAGSLTTALNQFNLGANKSLMAIDALAAGSVYGSSKIPQTAEALAKFGTIAAATGTKLNESIALIQLVSQFEKGAEAGTKLRNILAKMGGVKILPTAQQKVLKSMGVDLEMVSNSSIPFNQRLKEMAKIGKDNNAVMKVFGTENAALAQALLNNAGGFQTMLENVNQNGVAIEQATKNATSFAERIVTIRNSFLNMLTATNSNNRALDLVGTSMDWVAANMDKVILTAAGFAGVVGAMKLFVLITNVATVAQTLFAGATLAATWPILAIIAAIVAVIAVFRNWDDINKWFLGQLAKFTKWIKNIWDRVVDWFTAFDFKAFFKNIGQSILKFMLTPMRSILKLATSIPGRMGKMASTALDRVNELSGTGEIGINSSEAIPSPEQRRLQSVQEFKKSLLTGSLDINLNDPGKMIDSAHNNTEGIEVRIDSTMGGF